MMLDQLVRKAMSATYLHYILASSVALAMDYLCFLSLMAAGLPSPVAAGGGYCLGIVVHWLISSRFVFRRAAARSARRHVQKSLFVGSALAGLSITVLIVGLGQLVDLDPHLSKLMAIIISFQITYLLRAKVVFR